MVHAHGGGSVGRFPSLPPLQEQAHSDLHHGGHEQNQEWTEMALGCRKNIKGIVLKALVTDPGERKSLPHISMRNYSSAE